MHRICYLESLAHQLYFVGMDTHRDVNRWETAQLFYLGAFFFFVYALHNCMYMDYMMDKWRHCLRQAGYLLNYRLSF